MADGVAVRPNKARNDDPLRSKRKLAPRTLSFGVAVLALTAFAAILLYAYDEGRERSAEASPVVLRPVAGSYKMRPEAPGGLAVPDRDKEVYETIASTPADTKPERLMSGREEPLAPPLPQDPPAVLKIDKSAANVGVMPATAAGKLAVAVLSDETGTPEDGEHATAAPPKPTKIMPVPVGTGPNSETVVPDEKRLIPKRKKAGKPDRRYRVQLASLRSKAAADQAWKILLRENQDLLSWLDMSVQRADLGPPMGVYYRMQAGPFDDRASARKFCSTLVSRKIGCFVARR